MQTKKAKYLQDKKEYPVDGGSDFMPIIGVMMLVLAIIYIIFG